MARTDSAARRKPGRKPVDTEPVNVRMDRRLLDATDSWIASNAPGINRPEAVRRILASVLLKPGSTG